MSSWIVAAVIMTTIAAILGFTGLAGSATEFARLLFAVLLTVTLVLVGWRLERRRTRQPQHEGRGSRDRNHPISH